MNEKEINSMELDVYTKIVITNNTENNVLVFFRIIGLCREIIENDYKIIITIIIKISSCSHHQCAVNGNVDTEKMV